MSQGEATLAAGSGSQTTTYNRWGDYSSLSVDPADDCTFWYTQEYYQTTSDRGWLTRIGSFRFPSCGGSQGILRGVISDAATSVGIDGAQVQASVSPTQTSGTTSSTGGTYTLALPAGTYNVNASAYGYTPSTISGVSIISGTTTTLSIPLSATGSYVISGTVRDATTGWPLYAGIDVGGYPGSRLWNNPTTGFFSVALASGSPYTLTVSPWQSGYVPITRGLGLLAGNRTESFAHTADAAACTAPGYQRRAVYAQDFEANSGGYATGGATSFAWGTPTSGPGSAHSGSKVWATNPSGDYGNNEDGHTTSPNLDLSAYAGQSLFLSWWQWLQTESDYDFASVEASDDGGATWKRVYGEVSGAVDLAWTQHGTLLSASYAAANFRVRFRLRSDGSVVEPGYYVDDVSIQACRPQDGGLMVGNVYDANTGVALAGGTVSNDRGNAATALATDDPAVDDSFYTLFSAAGSRTFTATAAGGYGRQALTSAVVQSDTVRQNFFLPAGRLSYVPPTLEITLTLGLSATVPFTLSNSGGLSATYQLTEASVGTSPLLRDKMLPYKRQRATYSSPSETAPRGALAYLAPGAWGTGAYIPTGPRYRSAGASVDGQTYYVFGGALADGTVIAESWRYTPLADTWTRLADMPAVLMNMEAAAIGDFIYLVGGYNGSAHTNSFFVYDTVHDTWTASTWPNARTPMTAAWGGMLYAFGGNPGPSDETWMFDPSTGLWTGPLAAMPTASAYGAATTFGDHIFVVGGDATDDVQRYNPVVDAWDHAGPKLPAPRMNPMLVWYGDLLYASGGGGVGGDVWAPYGNTLILNPSLWPAGAWTATSESMPTPLVAAAYACARDRIYAAGGATTDYVYSANQYLDDGLRCNYPTNLTWLNETPITGTVPPLAAQSIALTFDAGAQITQTGRYYARLSVTQDTPYLLNGVPITLTVLPRTCLGDFDGDGSVSVADIQRIAYRWNARVGQDLYDPQYDGDGDGDIDVSDIQQIAYRWGTTCAAPPAAPTQPALPQPVALTVMPPDRAVAVGDVFTVGVSIGSAVDLGGFGFTLAYDPAVVEGISADVAPFLASTGRATLAAGPIISRTVGTLAFGGFSVGPTPEGPGGNGTLATLTFRALAPGQTVLSLLQSQVADRAGNSTGIEAQWSGRVTVSPANPQTGAYRFYFPLFGRGY